MDDMLLQLIVSSDIESLLRTQIPFVMLLHYFTAQLSAPLGPEFPLHAMVRSQRRHAAVLNVESRCYARDGMLEDAQLYRLRSLRIQHQLLKLIYRYSINVSASLH